MITASRLATEKHIDWLVAATVQAFPHAQLPELTLILSGKGAKRRSRAVGLGKQGGHYIRLSMQI